VRFVLEITLGNAAMQTGGDIADALEGVATKVHFEVPVAGVSKRICDVSGKTVGSWRFDN
jgi:hypothetical protein